LCMLSLAEPAAMDELVADHKALFEAVRNQDETAAVNAMAHHLSRLDDVVAGIRKSHADYFED